MALLLLILLTATFVFLFYYELLWKKAERERGQSLVGTARNFLFRDNLQIVSASSNAWDDWKYRLTTELHRREQLNLQDAAQIVGVSTEDVEQYFDELEGEGKVSQCGDAERGVFYKIVIS